MIFSTLLEQSPDPRTMDRVVPLAPDIAVRIHPSLDANCAGSGMAFPVIASKCAVSGVTKSGPLMPLSLVALRS